MASVRKRTAADGTVSYQIRFRYADGTATSRTVARARDRDRFLDRLAAARLNGIPLTPGYIDGTDTDQTPPPLTVADWLTTWLERQAARARAGNLAPKSLAGRESDIRLHLTPALGDTPLADVTVSQVEQLLDDLAAAGKPGAARSVRLTLSAAYTAAERDGLVTRNPARIAAPPKGRPRRISAFTPDELAKIAGACRTHEHGPLYLLAVYTGMRSSELVGLRWDDVDLDAGVYTVRQGLHRVPRRTAALLGTASTSVTGDPKSPASARTTPLAPAAVDLLRRHRTAQTTVRLAARRWLDTGHVFTTPIGTPVDARNVARAFTDLLNAADIPTHSPDGHGRGLHELRRTFVDRLRRAGVHLEDVQGLGRWASPHVLLQHYAAAGDDRLRDAAAAAGDDLDAG